MFAETRWRIDGEDCLQGLPGIELSPDNANLPLNATKAGYDEKHNPVFLGGLAHLSPGRCRRGRQAVAAAVVVGLNEFQLRRFGEWLQATRLEYRGVDTQAFQFLVQLCLCHG